MKTQLKKWLGALLLAAGFAGAAQAATTDSLTVMITPTAAYAVAIDTGGSTPYIDLGAVGLGLSTYTLTIATVEVQSSYAATDLTIQGFIPPADVWTLDADTTTQTSDSLQAWAVFTDTSNATGGAGLGAQGGFDAADLLTSAVRDVGQLGAGSRQYELTAGQPAYKSMEDMVSSLVDVPASRSHLWLKFKLPPATTDTNPKHVSVILTAGAPN